jgi:hypothetical protein
MEIFTTKKEGGRQTLLFCKSECTEYPGKMDTKGGSQKVSVLHPPILQNCVYESTLFLRIYLFWIQAQMSYEGIIFSRKGGMSQIFIFQSPLC